MLSRKICVVTGTRAEYGLLRWVIDGIANSSEMELQLIATGMHLSPEFGLTLEEIIADGYRVDRKVEMLLSSDTAVGITKSMGVGMMGFADTLSDLQPDMVIVLGDRFEIFAASCASLIACIPIAHIHGGELTEGAFDDSIRHSITKMAHLHFVATEEYKRRVIQLGEHPDRVFNVGGLGIDSIIRLDLISRPDLESALNYRFCDFNLLVTFHPVTLDNNSSLLQFEELLSALSSLENTGIIFTMPNADTNGRILIDRIHQFCATHTNAKAFISLGHLRYLSCVAQVDAVVGNSSSGLLEVPSFRKATINIGDRQLGRIKATSVVDCKPNSAAILGAIKHVLSPDFKSHLSEVINPYGSGGASSKIVDRISKFPLDGLIKKSFFDI